MYTWWDISNFVGFRECIGAIILPSLQRPTNNTNSILPLLRKSQDRTWWTREKIEKLFCDMNTLHVYVVFCVGGEGIISSSGTCVSLRPLPKLFEDSLMYIKNNAKVDKDCYRLPLRTISNRSQSDGSFGRLLSRIYHCYNARRLKAGG